MPVEEGYGEARADHERGDRAATCAATSAATSSDRRSSRPSVGGADLQARAAAGLARRLPLPRQELPLRGQRPHRHGRGRAALFARSRSPSPSRSRSSSPASSPTCRSARAATDAARAARGLARASRRSCLAGPPAAATEPPPALIEATEQAAALCRALGGTPVILDRYEPARDLNGDGRDDFVTDLAGLRMHRRLERLLRLRAAARSRAWLSRARRRLRPLRLRPPRRLRDRATARPLPAGVAHYHGTYCDDDSRIGADPAPAPGSSPATRPRSRRSTPDAGRRAGGRRRRRADPAGAGRRLDAAPGAGVEPGRARRRHRRPSPRSPASASQGQPFLARHLPRAAGGRQRHARLRLQPGRARSRRPASSRPPAAPTSWRSPTARSPRRLAGRDTEVAVSVDGAAQGILSLAGSTKALRGALEDCR